MSPRQVIRTVLEGGRPPYVPWHFSFTYEAWQKLTEHYARKDLDDVICPHYVGFWSGEKLADIGAGRFRDHWGVVWDRTVDKDIGQISGCVLPEPTLKGYEFPDPLGPAIFPDIPGTIAKWPDRFREFSIGFSLYERAWTLRGMENLMMDFVENPKFAHELLEAIADYNIAQVRQAVKHDIDAVHFGDDWGMQHGLQMGYPNWSEFIYPQLKRMYKAVKDAGKLVTIHSCGDVDELFDDLFGIGLNCFNPFQPEVMDVPELHKKYLGRLAFFGGMSTQRTLPYGSPDEVRQETRRLIEMGRPGGYIFAPAHSVEGDVPVENMVAMIEEVRKQPGAA